MTLTTKTAVLDALPGRVLPVMKAANNIVGAAALLTSLWKQGTVPVAGATPPTGVGEVPTNATTGALDMGTAGAGNALQLGRIRLLSTNASGSSTFLLLYDRLVHTSGLDATLTSAQTVNSVAVTRPSGTGAGAMAFLEVYTATGATAQNFTASYTNQAGTSGRSGTGTLGASGRTGDLYPIALAPGDTGVRSVESVTLAASTGTAGNFGVTILRPLTYFNQPNPSLFANPMLDRDWLDCALAGIDAGACLAFAAGSALTANFVGEVAVIEG